MLLSICAAALLSTAPHLERPWELASTFSAGVAPGVDAGGGGFAGLTVSRSFTAWFRPELGFGLGARMPGDLVNVIRVGARFEWPWERQWRPFLSVAFAHNHETPFEAASKNPIGSALGLEESGVRHRSGIEGGLGVAALFGTRPEGPRAIVGGRLMVAGMAGVGPVLQLGAQLSLGVAF